METDICLPLDYSKCGYDILRYCNYPELNTVIRLMYERPRTDPAGFCRVAENPFSVASFNYLTCDGTIKSFRTREDALKYYHTLGNTYAKKQVEIQSLFD